MDTEKYIELENKIERGESPNDEGPFYHHAFWESYKGSIKGKLGGVLIGAAIGAIVGALTITALSMLTSGMPLYIIFGGLTALGIKKGVEEFSEIGKIVGAESTCAEQRDAREAIRFSMIEKKLDNISESLSSTLHRDRILKSADKERETSYHR